MKKNKKILFRADANSVIGSGHIMRCLSIANAFRSNGCEVSFISADKEGEILVVQKNIQYICIDGRWDDLDKEIDVIIRVINDEKPDLLIVDSYYVTRRYFDDISDFVKVAYIDDQNTNVWNVDYLINYNIFGPVMDYSGYSDTRTTLLLGRNYAPLRDEFNGTIEHKIKNVTDIMVSAGGSDSECVTEKMMTELCPIFGQINFHFVVGALNPRLNIIKGLVQPNTILHINEKNMSDLMKKCDLAISAAGSTLYELCACGTPTITYTLADNQIIAAEQFDAQGILLSAGDCRKDDRFLKRVEFLLKKMVGDSELRTKLSQRMQELVDGYGAERIVDALLREQISM